MSENNITIYQTLHGYSNGHHLLESSILLSDESKRKMDILSDLSGGDIAEEFNFYYSGYYLENEDMIVFAKTWYALEMPRPGCVWTHSLLIPVKNIYSCSLNIEGILNLFKRPIINDVQTDYSESFSIDLYNASIFEFDDKKIQYLIWVMLGQTPPNCIISKDSEDFVKELLFVWFVCYNELSYDYSFITGMSVAKKDSNDLISLQFYQNEYRSKLNYLPNELTLIKSIDDVKKFPQWVMNTRDLLLSGEWEKFLLFKELLYDKNLNHVAITSFIKLYSSFYKQEGVIDIYASLELIDKLFDTERSLIGNKLLIQYLNGRFEEWGEYNSPSNIIIATIKFRWIEISPDGLIKLINKSFLTDFNGSKKIVQYLVKIDDVKLQEQYLPIYANLLSSSFFKEFSNMDYSVCSVLIGINPTLATCDEIWKQSKGFQQGMLNALQLGKKEKSLDTSILRLILNISNYDFCSEIYEIWGETSISIFLEYLLGMYNLQNNDSSRMREMCKSHSYIAASLLEERIEQFTRKEILDLVCIINPFVDKLNSKLLISAYSILDINSLNEYNKNIVADFYFPYIIRAKDIFPCDMVSFVVTNVHDRLMNLSYPEDNWIELQKILPSVTVFNQWDKCKRLRKAIKKKGYNIKKLNSYNDSDEDIHLL